MQDSDGWGGTALEVVRDAMVRAEGVFGRERQLANRIATERDRRKWSQSRLSREMGKAGFPIHQSAISKIESYSKGSKRSVTADELLGFAQVFGMQVGELLLPTDYVDAQEANRAVVSAVERWISFQEKVAEAVEHMRANDRFARHLLRMADDDDGSTPSHVMQQIAAEYRKERS